MLASDRCGCFCCCGVFAAAEIEEWIDDDQTALCPHCGIDAVIGSASGYPIAAGFLRLMEAHFFEGDRVNAGVAQAARCALGNRVSKPTHRLLCLTISGEYLHGFASESSAFDLRGVHILPGQELLCLGPAQETIEWTGLCDAREIDLVTHDSRKFFLMLLKPNGHVLEQLHSPLVVHTTSEHDELKDLARGCLTRQHADYYLAFARDQWARLATDRRLRRLLHVYRALLTGTRLMQTGQVEPNLRTLNDGFRLSHVYDLLGRRWAEGGQDFIGDAEMPFHQREYRRLARELEQARAASKLPESPTARPAFEDLLLRLRRAATAQGPAPQREES